MAYALANKSTGIVERITDTAPIETFADYCIFETDSLKPGDEIGYEITARFNEEGELISLSTIKIGLAQREINSQITAVKEQQALMQEAIDDLIMNGGGF